MCSVHLGLNRSRRKLRPSLTEGMLASRRPSTQGPRRVRARPQEKESQEEETEEVL